MRIQLTVVMILVGILPMLIFSKIVIGYFHSNAINQRIGELQYQGTIISNLVLNSNFFSNEENLELNAELKQVADVYRGRILVVNGELRVVRDTYGLEEDKTIISRNVVQCFRGGGGKRENKDSQIVEIAMPITDAATKEVLGAILMSFSTESIYKLTQRLNYLAYTLYVILAMFVILVAFVYSTYIVKPLKKVSGSIDRISEGFIDEAVSIQGFLEVEAISDSFNQMIGVLNKQEETRQEFVSNVSHELKTPITSIKLLADSLLMQEDVPIPLYQEFLEDITDAVGRADSIIEDLLTLVKMDKSAANMIITNENVNEFLEQILKQMRPIAAKRNIELVYENFRAVNAEIDKVKLSMALSNLIENSIKYNYDDGWVRVSLNADHKFFYVKVEDSGVGIPEDVQDQIFERFYRVDKARSRETGGTGLGLAIARNAVLMHRGAIKVYSKEKQGSVFTVRVPLNYQV